MWGQLETYSFLENPSNLKINASNFRRRPPFVSGIPTVREILELRAETPMNLHIEKPPRSIAGIPNETLVSLAESADRKCYCRSVIFSPKSQVALSNIARMPESGCNLEHN